MRASGDYLLITTPNTVYIYNQQLALAAQINNSQITDVAASFTCATIINGTIYIGTTEHGVITTSINNPFSFQLLSPSGPSRNNIFAMTVSTTAIWTVYGNYTEFYDPNPLRFYGISKYTQEAGWLNIPYGQVNQPSIVRVAVNPANENQVFFSSYYGGLLKFENDALVTTYNAGNTGTNGLQTVLATDPPDVDVRIEQSVFDKSGNLWMTNGLVKAPLKVLKSNGQWASFNLESVMDSYFDSRYGRMSIDKNGTKWLCTISDGLIGFNETYNNLAKRITEGADKGNLPSSAVQVAAIDLRNQIWIGTRNGLRVISADSFLGEQEQLTANPIIILEDGIGQELLFEQFITDIVVDGANNKWVGTADAGVFLFSPNGQETLHHFTNTNSPLPSNNVNDIDIDPVTGEVFFATVNGMVSYKGNAIKASDDLKNVVVYPNPVRPGFEGTVKITGLLDKADIKITDIEGNLVYETISEGGTIEWDTKAFGKYKVASGVYMIFISAQDGGETTIKKVMIIR
jgi:hypothetical protein